MPPFVSTILRMAGRGGEIKDNFNRSAANLGVTSLGATPWQVVSGTWSTNGSRPTTSTSHSSNPFAKLAIPVVNPQIEMTLGAGDAIYFRVQDSSNWWRTLWEGYQTSNCQQCCSTCCSTCCGSCAGYRYQCNSCGAAGSCVSSPSGGCSSVCGGCPDVYCHQAQCSYSCNCGSCNCYSCNCNSCNCTYSDNYRMKLQKMVGGTLTTVSTGPVVGTSTTRAKVVLASGDAVSAYYGSSAQTSLYSGQQADLSSALEYGFGRGASNYNTSALDDFQITWN